MMMVRTRQQKCASIPSPFAGSRKVASTRHCTAGRAGKWHSNRVAIKLLHPERVDAELLANLREVRRSEFAPGSCTWCRRQVHHVPQRGPAARVKRKGRVGAAACCHDGGRRLVQVLQRHEAVAGEACAPAQATAPVGGCHATEEHTCVCFSCPCHCLVSGEGLALGRQRRNGGAAARAPPACCCGCAWRSHASAPGRRRMRHTRRAAAATCVCVCTRAGGAHDG